MKKTLLALLLLFVTGTAPAAALNLAAGKGPLPKNAIPEPVYAPAPEYVDLYWKAWELAWDRVKYQEGVPQSPYIDENLWDDTIWIWDTEFMVLFCRYAPDVFPGIESLDNFYKTILDKADTSLRIQHPDNPPFFSWVEWEYYKYTGDRDRLRKVLVDNRYLQRHYEWFENLSRGTELHFRHAPILLERTDKGYRWGNIQSGMDNTPRADDKAVADSMLWVDALAQQALSALYIERIARELGEKDVAAHFAAEYKTKKSLLDKYYWDETDGTYYDYNPMDSSLIKVRTPAAYWPMLARVPDKQQARRLARLAADSLEFGGRRPWPTVNRSSRAFDARYGDYWRGAIWLPTAYMATKALDTYGFHDIAAQNAAALLRQMYRTYVNYKPHTIWECYAPSSDEPSHRVRSKGTERVRPDFCGWSALGPISMFIENVIGFYNIDYGRRLVEWRRQGDGLQGIRRLRFGSVETDILSDGATLHVVSNQAFTLKMNGRKFKIKPGENKFRL